MKITSNKLQYCQGDVPLYPVSNEEIVEAKKINTNVIKEGEMTGHAHRVECENGELYEKDGVLYLKVEGDTVVTHNTHHTQIVKKENAKIYRTGKVIERDMYEDIIREQQD